MNVSSAIGSIGPAAAPSHQPPPSTAATPPPAPGKRLVTREQLDVAVERANETLRRDGSLQFAIHEGTNRILVRIVDPASMEIIREFPDSEFLDMMAKLQELAGLQLNVQT